MAVTPLDERSGSDTLAPVQNVRIKLELSPEQTQLLQALRERDSDGYTLLRRTKLSRDKAETALRDLISKGMVQAEGVPSGLELDSTYFWVKPDMRGLADYVTGRL